MNENYQDFFDALSNKILFLRNSKKISQEDMANILGVSQSQYSKIERGVSRITLESLFRLCQEMSCRIVIECNSD